MSDPRRSLAPGQSRVFTASAFGRIGFLLAAAILTIPRAPAVAAVPEVPERVAPIEVTVPHRLACLVADSKTARCASTDPFTDARTG